MRRYQLEIESDGNLGIYSKDFVLSVQEEHDAGV